MSEDNLIEILREDKLVSGDLSKMPLSYMVTVIEHCIKQIQPTVNIIDLYVDAIKERIK
jgi:hypothetical protein